MTESERVFIDTAPIIYLLEDDPNFGAAAAAAFQKLILSESRLYTSAVTCEEYLVYAYRGESPVLERAFSAFCLISVSQLRIFPRKPRKKRRKSGQDIFISKRWTLYSLHPHANPDAACF